MTTDNFCFYFKNRLIQSSQTGAQQYSDTSPFSIPWFSIQHSIYVIATLCVTTLDTECHFSECHSSRVSFILSVANEPIILSVFMLSDFDSVWAVNFYISLCDHYQ
jgi:hypothetical protein